MSADTVGIHAVGAYAPRARVEAEAIEDAWGRFEGRGIDRTAVPAADEDSLTIAARTARLALDAAGIAGPDLDFLAFATTTPPLAEEDLSVHLGAMLGVPDDATRQVFTGSTRAGTRGLWAALDAAASGNAGGSRTGSTEGSQAWRGLVVAADCPRGEPDSAVEHAAGAGAGAIVVGPDAPARISDRAERTGPRPGTRFRPAGEERTRGLGITAYDRAAFTEPVAAAVDAVAVDPDAVDAAVVQAPDGDLPYRAARAAGLPTDRVETAAVSEVGDTGAASVPIGLARALAEGADGDDGDTGRVLAVSHGSGAGADALVIDARDPVPAALDLEAGWTVSYPEYLRLRDEVTPDPPAGGGAYVSVPAWERSIPQRYRLEAGRCRACGGLAYPPEGACPDCGELVEYDPVELPGTGTVEAVTTVGQGGAPPEFAPQQARGGAYGIAIVAFDGPGGDAVSAPVQVVEGSDPGVGDRVEATIRRIYTQENLPRYGAKVRSV